MRGENPLPPVLPVRFGPYEADFERGELRKHGVRIKLQDQPLRILQLLLKRPGEIIRREELIREIWHDGTFVDYDHGLNAAIAKLRQALSDSAEQPRYVETVERRGYRFVAAIEALPRPAAPAGEDLPVEPGRVRERSRAAGALFGATIAVAIAMGAFAFWYLRIEPQHTDGHRVVPVTNYPGVEAMPSFSPDGRQIAFCWDGENEDHSFDLYVKLLDAGEPVRLTTHGAWLPAWSPDGRSIAFVRYIGLGGSDRMAIFVVPALRGTERKVAEVYAQ
jgi:DNA-binding winged helix-turn-helix (wHTH) protein